MYLSATTESLQVVLAANVTTNQLRYNCSYQDITSSGIVLPQYSSFGNTNNTTDVTMVAAPAASTNRQITIIQIYNEDTTASTVIIKKDVSGTDYIYTKQTLQPGDSLFWTRERGWLFNKGIGQASVTFTSFTSSGTYTKPNGLKAVLVFCIGAGSGGGSGRRGAAGTSRFGGCGGCGGAISWRFIGSDDLPPSVPVTTGIGGTGGAGQTVDDTNGNSSGAGGSTSFGEIIIAIGAGSSGGGTTTTGGFITGAPASSCRTSNGPFSLNGAGGASGTSSNGSAGASGLDGGTGPGGPGGGGGGGINNLNVSGTSGGAGGGIYQNGVGVAGPTSGNGLDNKSIYLHFSTTLTSNIGIGTGGAGGYPASVNGGNGGYGAGGGGGSGTANGTTSGKGGDGGGGLCIVMNIF